MIDRLLLAFALAAALGSGLMAGLFFAFSVAVMGALSRIEPPAGIAAMQAINRVIVNPLFMLAFLGTAMVCGAVAAAALWRWQQPGAAWLLAGSVLYLVGSLLVTITFNVPMNDALAAVEPASADALRLWRRYLVDWTNWNHLRTGMCLAATACFILAIRAGAQ